MGEADDEELQKAFLMSLQPAPEPKRSKPRDNNTNAPCSPSSDAAEIAIAESAEARDKRLQRELRAAAAERRMSANKETLLPKIESTLPKTASPQPGPSKKAPETRNAIGQLPFHVAEKLFTVVFGTDPPKDVLAQWCNQGFRFSSDEETSLGLVQREGGPCGVLAPIQALVLKYLLFIPENANDSTSLKGRGQAPDSGSIWFPFRPWSANSVGPVSVFTEAEQTRALVLAMGETLWLVGCKQRVVVAVLDTLGFHGIIDTEDKEQDEVIAKALDNVSLDSPANLHRILRICTFTSKAALLSYLQSLLPGLRSRVGALLFLFSALLSRGLDMIQADRDDPGQPLVTSPFGHASQEVVNLLLCGQAVSNVFDGSMDLGGGMFLKGIPRNVEVGFLTLLESLNLCKVGQHLKNPKWPIWVVGSESHYTVLFALHTSVQDENELEEREMRIRQAFDVQDQSGGGGFITADALQQVLQNMNINMPQETLANLCSTDIIVWNDFWQALHQLDKSNGGLRDPECVSGKRHFELYHFNGIAKTVGHSMQSTIEAIQQRPRLTRLRVTVPPKWAPEEFMIGCKTASPERGLSGSNEVQNINRAENVIPSEEPAQHAPLVDCVRTRWQRATCNWSDDPPSIV